MDSHLSELQPYQDEVVVPGGMPEKRVMITPHATEPCSLRPRTPKPRTPNATSLLETVVYTIPQTHLGDVPLPTPGGDGSTDRQLGTFVFHDRLAAEGVGTPALTLRQLVRVSRPSVRFSLLLEHEARPVRKPRAAPVPPLRTMSAYSPWTGMAGQRPRTGGTEKHASSAVAPTGRGRTTDIPGGSSCGPSTRGEGLPHSDEPPE